MAVPINKVTYSRVVGQLTVTIQADVTDLTTSTAPDAQKLATALQRCVDQLTGQVQSQNVATINAQIAALQAQVAALPPPVPAF